MTEEDEILKKLNEELGNTPKDEETDIIEETEETQEETQEEKQEKEEKEVKDATFKHEDKKVTVKPKRTPRREKPKCPYCKLDDSVEKIVESDDNTIYKYGRQTIEEIWYCHRCGRRFGVYYE